MGRYERNMLQARIGTLGRLGTAMKRVLRVPSFTIWFLHPEVYHDLDIGRRMIFQAQRPDCGQTIFVDRVEYSSVQIAQIPVLARGGSDFHTQ